MSILGRKDEIDESSFVNDYLLNLRPYKIASQEIWSMTREMKENSLKLDWNEATIEPPPEVKKAIIDFISSEDFFRLYPSTYNDELIKLLSLYANVPRLNIQYFASSDSLHEYIAKLFISVGDKVMILQPSYDNFRATAAASGANIIFSDMTEEFRFDPYKIKEDIRNENPKLVYICNPNNPTGDVLAPDQIEELLIEYPKVMFLIDEAYAEFAYQTVNHLALKYNNILITHTMSKAFALANVRFGYLVASIVNIDAINRIRNPKNISTITQIAVISALNNIDYMWEYVKKVNIAKEWFFEKLTHSDLSDKITIFPSKANFILLKCCNISVKSKIFYHLRNKKIYVRQLQQCKSVLNCIRITIGTQEQMERVYYEICRSLKQ